MKACFAMLMLLVGAHAASAQTKLVGLTGIVYRYQGDTIWIDHDSTGRMVSPAAARGFPSIAATMERQQLETELRTSTMLQHAAAVTGNMFQLPESPDPSRRYTVSPTLAIVQHRDTVWYVRGCPALGRVDTTMFLMFGSDSVRRLSTPERTFGEAMSLGLLGQMRSTLVRERAATMLPTPVGELPTIRDQCLPRK